MEHNSKFSPFFLGNLQREYSLQLANLQMQLIQRSLLCNGMMPIFPSPLAFPSLSGINMLSQNQPLPELSKIPAKVVEYRPEIASNDLKKSEEPLQSLQK